MKKKLLLPMLSLFLIGCSSEDVVNDNKKLPDSYVNSYLSINVLSANGAGTRADENPYPKDDGTYQDGEGNENAVKSVYFFFFDDKGEPAMVKKTESGEDYQSWVELESVNDDGNSDHSETVEKIVTTTLSLNIPDGSKNPYSVLVVLNPTSDIEKKNISLDDLKTKIADYNPIATTEGSFVMSNSVYATNADGTGDICDIVLLKDDNFQALEAAAKENPVTIYVERVCARLDFSIELENSYITLSDGVIYKLPAPGEEVKGDSQDEKMETDTQDDAGNGKDDSSTGGYFIDGTPEDIYVKFEGWSIAGTPVESRLIKKINKSWTTTQLFGENAGVGPWTTQDYHRSFWALNPNLGETPTDATTNKKYKFVSYNNIKNTIPSKVYLQENANSYAANEEEAEAKGPDYPTKVILAAKLVDEKGEAKKIAKWLNGYYTVEGVKTAMANRLHLYKRTEESGDVTYTKIKSDDLEFKPVEEAMKEYYATATVEGVWYEKNGEGNTEDDYKELENVNTYIKNKLGYALVWETGETYYYFDIRHLGKNESDIPAQYGIVRNHIYKAKLTSVAGLGTPVYDSDEEIFPRKPENESIVSAKVNILSWRIVSQDYDLKW